ncbi:MAG: hypothetical protein R2852_01315 [Bacteroidia bacterium]
MVLNSAQEILKAIQSVQEPNIVITTHAKPDADAIGSSLGLKFFLESFGFHVDFISPTDFASFLKWMKDVDKTIIFEHSKEEASRITEAADFIFAWILIIYQE